MNHDEIIANRAHPGLDSECAATCPDGGQQRRCDGTLLFAMRDDHHAFTMDMVTVLQCIRIAEREGDVPPLPGDWWREIINHYKIPSE